MRMCDQCNKAIFPGEGCYVNEDEGSYYCSDACLTAGFDDNPGPGKWRVDMDTNEAGGYISVLVDDEWTPLNTFCTSAPEDECDITLEHCGVCKGAIVNGRCLCEKEGTHKCDNPTCDNDAVEQIGDKQFCEGCMGAYLSMNSLQSEEDA